MRAAGREPCGVNAGLEMLLRAETAGFTQKAVLSPACGTGQHKAQRTASEESLRASDV